MGTHIDGFFSWNAGNRRTQEILETLNQCFQELAEERAIVEQQLRWSSRGDGKWWLIHVDAEPSEPAYYEGEGPGGFSIVLNRQVGKVTSIARYGQLYDERIAIAKPLRKVLCHVARCLGGSERIAIAAGGFGDTDKAADLAHYQEADLAEVSTCLRQQIGEPTDDWSRLDGDDHSWYFGPTA